MNTNTASVSLKPGKQKEKDIHKMYKNLFVNDL